MKYDIFISYRRKDSSGRSNVPTARQFKMAFEASPYNYKVFFDYSECADNYFSDTILPAIRTCDFFVLVLTKDCLARCSNEGDWVRREIEEAIAYDRKIIPITPDKECENWPQGLPESLHKLEGLQITTVYTDHMFESGVKFLVDKRFHLDIEQESGSERKIKEAKRSRGQEHRELERTETQRRAKPGRTDQLDGSDTTQPKPKKALWIALGLVAVIGLLLVLLIKPKNTELEPQNRQWQARQQVSQNTSPFTSSSGSSTSMVNGHEYVDFGLPSGTLWATCNVGAETPEDFGDYFAWGETTTKSTYTWATYKYAKGECNGLTKYCKYSGYGYNGFADNLTTLQSSDDPASANWGNGWHLPTERQWDELLNNTTNQWTTRNGVKGRLFTSKKDGQTIFLPAAGYHRNSEADGVGLYVYYWSRSLDKECPYFARNLYFNSGGGGIYYNNRYCGFSVRPIR